MSVSTERRSRALALALALALAGCASGPREQDLLPDEGPTTLEVYERHMGGQIAGEAGEGRAAPTPGPTTRPHDLERREPAARPIPVTWGGEPVAPDADAASRRGREALDDLRRDFQRVPNPEILGYVYPHVSGEMPVPGYYTSFPLREGSHYAGPGEGVYPEASP